jgi:acyl carrier protein
MIPKAMDSLDLVEAVMLIEEILGTEIPDSYAQSFGSPREMVDWLERHLSNQRPNKEAAAVLRKLAKAHNNPELAEGLEGTWRREQIAAIVPEIFRQGSE